MSQPRRRMFGPLFYTTAAIAIFVFTLVQIDAKLPQVVEWQRQRALQGALRADDSREREEAAAALVRSGSRSALPYLLEAARDPRSELRMLACRYLVESSTEHEVVVPSLIAAASDIDPSVRLEAALALGRIRLGGASQVAVMSARGTASGLRTEIITALRRLLKDNSSATRVAAADALGHFGPDAATAAHLVTAIRDQKRNVRFAAARALLKVSGPDDPSAGQTLVALVGDPEPIADRRAVLDVVMSASEAVQDQAAAVLAGLLSDVDTSSDADVIDCLVPLGPRARVALPALGRLLDDEDPAHRALAGIAFATIGGKSVPRAIPTLLRILDDLSLAPEWRQSALGKIRELDEAELVNATPILIRQLASKNQDVRLAAMEMLGQVVYDTPAELPAASVHGAESPTSLPSK
jgi:HEAT repeat protein